MAGNWFVVAPLAARNRVLNPSGEVEGNYGTFQGSPSASPSASNSSSGSPSPSSSASRSNSPSASQSKSPSASSSPSGSTSTSPSKSLSPSASLSKSPSASVSFSPSVSASESSSASASPSPSSGFTVLSRVTTQARQGDWSYFVAAGSTNDGGAFTLETLANAIHYASVYIYGNAAATIQLSLDGVTFNAASRIGGRTGGWVRYGVQIPAAQANGSTQLAVRNTADEDFYIDCLQVEQSEYATTYLDGSLGPLFRWTGLAHGSASTRDAQERAGGRELNFTDDLAITVTAGTKRHGISPIRHNVQGLALLPGGLLQSTKQLPREIELEFLVQAGSSATTDATALASFHSYRKDLVDLLKPDLVRGAQPVVIGYSGADGESKLWGAFHYAGGLELTVEPGMDKNEQPRVRLLAPDPHWYADDRQTATLDFSDTVTFTTGGRRADGAWSNLGSGFDSTVYAIAADEKRGRVYYGGVFTIANGVTVNGVCYYDGTTFVPMGGGVGGGNGVYAIAIAPNGDVWAVGDFTSVDGQATKGMGRWNLATGTWSPFNVSATFTALWSVVISTANEVYFAGNFENWNGIAAADFVAKYSNGAFSALGTSPFSSSAFPNHAQALAVDIAGNLWAGEYFQSGSGTASVRKWDGANWTTVLTTGSMTTPYIACLLFAPNGDLYVTGNYATLGGTAAANAARYNGAAVYALGSGVTGIVSSAAISPDGLFYLGGFLTSAGGISLVSPLAIFNGYTWVNADGDLPSSEYKALAFLGNDLYAGWGGSGDGTVAGRTTVTTTSSTITYPTFTLVGPSSSTCVLHSLENQSTDQQMYFNLTIQAGETITISLLPGMKQVTSDWRGLIYQQPLANSDFANWHLLPGANTVAAFMTGTTTGAALLAHWVPCYWSVDGTAA